MRIGAVLFLVGAVATIATVVPFLIHSHPLPTAAYLVSMVMPLGMALALIGLLTSALAQKRRIAAKLSAER
ncbi:hypothetical protein BIV57_12850 [Mangrovactinospora gilvigrisea]|uniref:Uncharacterized protein n=1 Tax=Mangrovactinospora gilvigrisea TaxID=1428644 RepID=A0A1J7BUB3_9ACTN|nr:hypothetical protein BIV57_12850 [Mangrovactinospora gilvigrisea]